MKLRLILPRILRELIGVLTLSMMVLPGAVEAQDIAVSMDELLHSGSLQLGDGVYVTDATEHRIKGTISDISSTTLVVTHRGQARTVTDANVRKIDRQDSWVNGIAYGMLTTGGSISALCWAGKSNARECGYVLLYAFPVIAVGGVLGGVIDAFKHKTVYRSSGSIRASVSPIVAHRSLGTHVRITW